MTTKKRGRPKKIRTPQELIELEKKEANKGNIGRPKTIRTQLELDQTQAKIDRKAKKLAELDRDKKIRRSETEFTAQQNGTATGLKNDVQITVEASPQFEADFLELQEDKEKSSPARAAKSDDDIGYLITILKEIYDHYEPITPDEQVELDENVVVRQYTPKQMLDGIMRYFEITFKRGQPITITGMAMFMGLTRYRLMQYRELYESGRLNKHYHFLIECVNLCEMYNEYCVHKKQNPAGAIFILKNFGWQDRMDINTHIELGGMTETERETQQKNISNFSE